MKINNINIAHKKIKKLRNLKLLYTVDLSAVSIKAELQIHLVLPESTTCQHGCNHLPYST